jgi:hypothetical protein
MNAAGRSSASLPAAALAGFDPTRRISRLLSIRPAIALPVAVGACEYRLQGDMTRYLPSGLHRAVGSTIA